MKKSFTLWRLFIVFAALPILNLSGCKKDTPSPQDVVTSKLTNTNWKIRQVTADGVDKTSMYNGLTIQFTSTSYATTHGGIVWPSSGTWVFHSSDGTLITRNDGLELTITVTDHSLDISLIWAQSTFGHGRVNSISGNHVFSFVK